MPEPRDRYGSYRALQEREREGRDYVIFARAGRTDTTVMAPHGGEIEPGTSEIARAIAGDEHGFYAFEGRKPRLNRILHLTSTRFDEPRALALARRSRLVVTIHGCGEARDVVYVGSRCASLLEHTTTILGQWGFAVDAHQRLRGRHPDNLCNLGRGGKGIQLELTAGLRRTLFQDLTPRGRQHPTGRFGAFVGAMRTVLARTREAPPGLPEDDGSIAWKGHP